MRAVLDACVLYPSVLREILLGVAARGLYEPVVSDRILREWTLATAKIGPAAQALAEAEALMVKAAFPRAVVREQPNIEARLALPDPDDDHVLAVAIGGHADAIVTFNAKDFPRPVLADHGLERRDPDGFLWELWSHHPAEVGAVVAAVHAQACQMAGEDIPLKRLLKKAQLWRLGKALDG
ncbi:PIN domain-containing protein [Rhodobacter sp. KR11]|uniref:RSP_2648 family PIN domain-containing protein n=1 Tax=Rhodobacter sp. KR11 TaxID=2974588 RepID=UPI0022225E18|nr:PIN domain-containing protein [Rhodobacter sp. KR11]MCW1919539.1 PIN domain-containing protein [Rhodobacter sp. KR11]